MKEPTTTWKVASTIDKIVSDRIISTVLWLIAAIIFGAGLLYVAHHL